MLTSMKFELPGYLMHQDRMVGWCTLFLTIVSKGALVHALDDDYDERERNHFWKSKKWAYANLNRLFVRYVFIPGEVCECAHTERSKDTVAPAVTRRMPLQRWLNSPSHFSQISRPKFSRYICNQLRNGHRRQCGLASHRCLIP